MLKNQALAIETFQSNWQMAGQEIHAFVSRARSEAEVFVCGWGLFCCLVCFLFLILLSFFHFFMYLVVSLMLPLLVLLTWMDVFDYRCYCFLSVVRREGEKKGGVGGHSHTR